MTGTPAQPVEHPFAYDDTFAREALTGGTERLRIGARSDQAAILLLLAGLLAPPYRVLYLLHTSRTDAPLGRYESPDLTLHEVSALLTTYRYFLNSDARHDVWLHSMPDDATMILDRYNMISVYGPLEQYERTLREHGIKEVAVWARPAVPYPHALHYHDGFDDAERTLLLSLDWHRKPLRPEDVQVWSGPQAS